MHEQQKNATLCHACHAYHACPACLALPAQPSLNASSVMLFAISSALQWVLLKFSIVCRFLASLLASKRLCCSSSSSFVTRSKAFCRSTVAAAFAPTSSASAGRTPRSAAMELKPASVNANAALLYVAGSDLRTSILWSQSSKQAAWPGRFALSYP